MKLRRRISKLKKSMEERGLEAFIITKSLRYFAGTTAGKIVLVPLDGAPILITSRLEQDQAREESWIKDVRAFSGWKAPLRRGERVYFMKLLELLGECLRESKCRVVGYEALSCQAVRRLKKLCAAGLLELPELVLDLRKIKDPEEIELLSKSAQIAASGMRAAQETIRPGVKEIEVAAQAEYAMRMAGSEGMPFETIVASGPNSWHPHARTSQKTIRRGELVIVDLGAVYKGYASDCTRTFAVGAKEKQLRLIEVVRKAQQAAISRLRDGIEASEISDAAELILKSANLLKYSLHGLGHGVGIEIHEPPSLHPGSKDVLKANMVVTIEPGVYLPRVGGARWEDMVLIEKSGASPLTMKYLS